ncbi:uncharacterized protein LOC109200020 isoform X1 [Oreochromis niloticus]|uniref:uncharacterized protein LOC109200020 isoform X1 n=1 Tax=Oreochromis niloticus TaxID=8128 RepID=UPI0009057498|nr:uncharacterized protein LOC109200020 isoform X1 [Oreochromis niloticus]
MAGLICTLLSACLLGCTSQVSLSDQKHITAESGQDVTLTCQAANNNIQTVEWSRADLGDEYVFLYRDEVFVPENQHPSFMNRVDLQDKQMKDGDVSVILKDVTPADSGTYECRVTIKTNRRKRANLDNDPICIITVSVVVPPGQTGGHTEDDCTVLIICLFVLVVFAVTAVAVAGFVIYRKHKNAKEKELLIPSQYLKPLNRAATNYYFDSRLVTDYFCN